jgi:membrane protein implicated in regulation of membrane protease activity
MTWSDFYLVCFLVGFSLSALALLAGSVHLHLPHLHMHQGVHIGGRGTLARGGQRGGLSWFNFGTIAAFLAWFGGTGFLLERYYHVWVVLALGVAVLSGAAAAAVVFWFLARVLMARETELDAADYDMIGVLGKLSIPIRAGGTGEIIYSQQGTRRVAGARAETGAAIPKGAEVVVTRYEKGIAYVRPWEEFAGDLTIDEKPESTRKPETFS